MRAFSAVLCVVVAACGSTGSKMAHVRPGIADVHPSLGRIYFYRPSEFPPRGQGFQRLDVTVNGRSVGVAAPGASFFIETEPGLKNLSIGPEAARNIVFDLKPGETRYVRAEVVMGWIVNTPQLRAVDQAVAEAEMADTTYYGSLD